MDELAKMESFRGKTRQDIRDIINKVVNNNKQTYEIINLTYQGCNYKSIAKNLDISDGTVIAVLNRLGKELGQPPGVHGGDVISIREFLLFYGTKKVD